MTPIRILFVDDEPDLRASTVQALDLAGFPVQDFGMAERVARAIGRGPADRTRPRLVREHCRAGSARWDQRRVTAVGSSMSSAIL